MDDKDIRFSEKQVDESWKERASTDQRGDEQAAPKRARDKSEEGGISFSAFVSSLGYQALIQMGEVNVQGSEDVEVNLDAAHQTIDLLVMIKAKTKSNLTPEEEKLLNTLLSDLQFKFVQHQQKSSGTG